MPLSTYRLQLNRTFRLRDATTLIPYLRRLGITDVYASPLLKARSGSMHGYDIADPTQLNPEIGTDADFDGFVKELHRNEMGLLLDIVPNHMAASSENPWWVNVLENGTNSPYATWFDIDWQPPSKSLQNKVLLPVLGCAYSKLLGGHDLRLGIQQDGFFLHYYETELPLAPRSYSRVLSFALATSHAESASESESIELLQRLTQEIEQLPESVDIETAAAIKQRVWQLYQRNDEARRIIDAAVEAFNDPARRGEGPLRALLSDQAYVLCFWRTANYEINYRRFFAVSDLVGVRVELPEVFEATHSLILKWYRDGKVNALRVDHVDGLLDPFGYLKRLQAATAQQKSESDGAYVVVEKILVGDEQLPPRWPIAGTTGYEFLNTLNALFVEPGGAARVQRTYARFLRRSEVSFEEIAYEKKKHVIATHFLGEMNALTLHLAQIAKTSSRFRRVREKDIGRAMVEVIACFPVYRTYIRSMEVSPRDKKIIETALAEARRRNPRLSRSAFELIRNTLLLVPQKRNEAGDDSERLRFVMRLQQFTGPIMAKGVEDTAFYIYNPLISANEVGGDPARLSLSLPEFHQRMRSIHRHWPETLNATSTHDTKRSEDVGARINVLSEIPDEWSEKLQRWGAANEKLKRKVKGTAVPEKNMEVLLYQTLIGAWPLQDGDLGKFRERIRNYMLKAVREAKVQTRWVRPNPDYEKALSNFVNSILSEGPRNKFLPDIQAFQDRIGPHGAINALSQLLIKITAPGTPDFYQGTEVWNLRLVDPDNREPVDFNAHQQLMRKLDARSAGVARYAVQDLMRNWRDGMIKLFLTSRALSVRREMPQAFRGDYIPLRAIGERAENVCSFARCRGSQWAVLVVPRFSTQVMRFENDRLTQQDWGETAVVMPANAPERLTDAFTGETWEPHAAGRERRLEIHPLFAALPFALLTTAR